MHGAMAVENDSVRRAAQGLDGAIGVHDCSAARGNSEPGGRSFQRFDGSRQPRPPASLIVRVDDHGDEIEHIDQFRCGVSGVATAA